MVGDLIEIFTHSETHMHSARKEIRNRPIVKYFNTLKTVSTKADIRGRILTSNEIGI